MLNLLAEMPDVAPKDVVIYLAGAALAAGLVGVGGYLGTWGIKKLMGHDTKKSNTITLTPTELQAMIDRSVDAAVGPLKGDIENLRKFQGAVKRLVIRVADNLDDVARETKNMHPKFLQAQNWLAMYRDMEDSHLGSSPFGRG